MAQRSPAVGAKRRAFKGLVVAVAAKHFRLPIFGMRNVSSSQYIRFAWVSALPGTGLLRRDATVDDQLDAGDPSRFV
jgi:hypothetical protein